MPTYKDVDQIMKEIEAGKKNLHFKNAENAEICAGVLAFVEGVIDRVPEADVEPVKHGYWIVRTKQKTPLSQAYIRIEKTFECSCCGAVHRRRMNYCGECGAKMDGDKNG